MVDLVAHLGTVCLLVSTQLKSRRHMHLGRIIGIGLWFVYGILIGNIPILVVEVLTIVSEVIAYFRFDSTE